jgi:hypothetical protein
MLEDVDYVATTADCWTAHHRSFMAMTCHWINKETRAREYAVLACRRLKGSHTFEVLSEAMTDIHCKFGIQDKITRTTTDNGSNYVKAFVQFGETPAALPALDVPVVEEDPDVQLEGPVLSQFAEETEDPVYFDVENCLVMDVTVHAYKLPAHMRCSSHTLNLVSSRDADKAMSDEAFATIANAAMTKARKLWNAQSRSSVQADVIQEELKRRLVVPNATRWNSIFDSIVVLNSILSDEKTR